MGNDILETIAGGTGWLLTHGGIIGMGSLFAHSLTFFILNSGSMLLSKKLKNT